MAQGSGNRAGLGNAVRELRLNQRISLDDLADRTGHTKTWIREVERGEHIPGDEALSELADALGVPTSALVARAG